MGYLEEFLSLINANDYTGFLRLWEEYCSADEVDGIELRQILENLKKASFATEFGAFVETALPLWKGIQDAELSEDVLALILDLQTTNSATLADITFDYLKTNFGTHAHFNEKLRLIGLRSRDKFRGAVRNYKLLTHMDKGNFVYHTGGWGVGEIIDLSLVREQLVVEFEYIAGNKDLPFEKAFRYLVPLPSDHFLARRFGNPDNLEAQAKKDPVSVIHLLLRDLGPKTALEIKEEMHELVIPAKDWSKWWQSTRAKLKKDTIIQPPASVREPFVLRQTEVSHDERLIKSLSETSIFSNVIQLIYSFLRDFPEVFKNEEVKQQVKQKLLSLDMQTKGQKVQAYFLLQDLFPKEANDYSVDMLLLDEENIAGLLDSIAITGLKKRILVALKNCSPSWKEIFADLFLTIPQTTLREYILKELDSIDSKAFLQAELERLLASPFKYPDTFVWFFQKVVATPAAKGTAQKEQQQLFTEKFLVLLSMLELKPEHRELVKKMYSMLVNGRYSLVRQILEGSTESFAKEFLLLVSKCSIFSTHDNTIAQSLVEVAHPQLKDANASNNEDLENVIWTTQEGYTSLQEKIKHLATVETVENAKEIEEARALGDLRENSEYKFALEKRSQLQAQIKLFTEQLRRARIITEADISTGHTGVGTKTVLQGADSSEQEYTILGPWDTNIEQNIISFQSKFAEALMGKKVGEKVEFQDKSYVVKDIASYLEKV